MKKRLFLLFFFIIISFLVIFYPKEKENEVEKITKNKIKGEIINETDYQKILKSYYISKENSNIEELLKDNIKYTYKINYICIKNENVTSEAKKTMEENNNSEEIDNVVEINEKVKNGFEIVDNNSYYYESGKIVTGFKTIDNNNYYFDENGIMLKNDFINKKYYDQDGKQVIGFYNLDGNIYYFLENGYITGLNEINNKKYYFDENGIMKKGIININGTNYLFNEEGVLETGFKKENDKIYFYNENKDKLRGLNLIEGKRYYFDFETGELKKENVKSIIDISFWQGDIDFDILKESNLVDGVIVRIGYGTSKSDKCVLDKKFKRNIEELNRLNIPYGIYLYGYAQTEYAAKKEAEFVINNLKKYNVNLSYPVFYDAEITSYKGTFYTKEMYEKVIMTFINELKSNNILGGVYGNLYMLSKGSLNSTLIKSNPIWVAQYYKICEYDEEHVGWQYTSKGSVPGINGNVDMNIFY